MTGLDQNTPIPTEIKLHQVSRLMEISFSDGSQFKLPYEYLRVYSPSAEVRGHGPGQETLQTGKRDVLINTIDAVGNYAVQPVFSDGHDSGIYSWDLLYDLGRNYEENWQDYLERLAAAGASREPDPNAPVSGGCGGGSCGHH
jgi:DUF971 family protein